MKTGRWMFVVGTLAVALLVGCADLSGGNIDTLPIDDDVQLPEQVGIPPNLMQVAPMPQVDTPPPEQQGMLLRIPHRGSLNVSLETIQQDLEQDFTLEVWLWFETDGNQTVLDTDKGLRISLDNGVLFGEVGGERLTGQAITRHEWYHVALVVVAGEARLYINGAFQDREFPPDGWERPTGTLVLGFRPDSLRSFIGDADNLRLVAGPVYSEPMFTPTNRLMPVDNTVFGYNFNDEAPGGKITDVAGKGVQGQLMGGAGLTTGTI